MFTTVYENGRFWLVDSATLNKDPHYPSFATLADAKIVAGDKWEDPGETWEL